MEFYDKLVDGFHPGSVKSKEYCCQQGKGLTIITWGFLKKMFSGICCHIDYAIPESSS